MIKKIPYFSDKTFKSIQRYLENEDYSSHYIVAYRMEDGRVFFNDPHELVGEASLDADTFQKALLGVFIAVKNKKNSYRLKA